MEMLFRLFAATALALLLSGCCCFGGSDDERDDDTDIPDGWSHREGTGGSI
jgi:hypothetical protein